MKAITVLQPWASLLATGRKKIETRSWKTNYRGEILIHAGKNDVYDIQKGDKGVYSNIIGESYLLEAVNELRNGPDGIQFGAIIGKCTLVSCVQIDEEIEKTVREETPAEYEFGDFTPERYAWIMADPVMFEKPIPAKGMQGIWNWEGDI